MYITHLDLDLTPEQFVHRPKIGAKMMDYDSSILDVFRKQLAESLKVSENSVYIVSVIGRGGSTEIYFTAYGSPWYTSNRVEAAVSFDMEKVSLKFVT